MVPQIGSAAAALSLHYKKTGIHSEELEGKRRAAAVVWQLIRSQLRLTIDDGGEKRAGAFGRRQSRIVLVKTAKIKKIVIRARGS